MNRRTIPKLISKISSMFVKIYNHIEKQDLMKSM